VQRPALMSLEGALCTACGQPARLQCPKCAYRSLRPPPALSSDPHAASSTALYGVRNEAHNAVKRQAVEAGALVGGVR
jgi:hypothetical protein